MNRLERLVSSYRLNKNNTHPGFVERGGLMEIEDEIVAELKKEVLPHGSGINYDWSINRDAGKDFDYTCYNGFQVMDENGFYCGRVDFTLKINIENYQFDVTVNRQDIKAIEADYETEAAVAAEDEQYDNPAPYMDDLGECIYETVDCSLELYRVYGAIKFLKDHYERLFLEKADEFRREHA